MDKLIDQFKNGITSKQSQTCMKTYTGGSLKLSSGVSKKKYRDYSAAIFWDDVKAYSSSSSKQLCVIKGVSVLPTTVLENSSD